MSLMIRAPERCKSSINVSVSINDASGSENMIADSSVRFARQLSREFRSRAERVLQARVSGRQRSKRRLYSCGRDS